MFRRLVIGIAAWALFGPLVSPPRTVGASVILHAEDHRLEETRPQPGVQRQQGVQQQQQQQDPLRFARSLYQDGLYDLAVDQLRQQLERGLPPQSAEDGRWLLAQALEAGRRTMEAAEAYLEFTSRHGSSARAPEAWLRCGRLFAADEEYGAAASAYRNFLDLYPANDQRPRASVGMISALLADHRTDEALSHVIEARRAYPFHSLQPQFLLLEAGAWSALGDTDQALRLAGEALEAATTADVRADAAALKAGLLASAGRTGEAIDLARTALNVPAPAERVPYLRRVLGEALEAAGRHEEALPELRAAVAGSRGADRTGAAIWLARALTAVGEPDSALVAYDVALSEAVGDEAATVALEASASAAGSGFLPRALAYADHARREARTTSLLAEAVAAAADVLVRLDRCSEAVDRYRALLERSDLPLEIRAKAAMSVGLLYERYQSDPGSAAGYYRLAAVSAGSGELYAEALWASACALASLGEYASAVTELQPLAGVGGDWGERVMEQIDYWRTYRLVDLDAGLKALQGALLSLADGGEAGIRGALLEIARANAGALKDYETAVDAYDRFLARARDGPEAAQAYLEKGRVLEAMATVAAREEGEQRAQEPRDRAGEAYREAVRVGGTGSASERAQLALIELDLAALKDQPVLYYQAMNDRYRAFLDIFTASDRLSEVLLRMGEANEGLGRHADPSYFEEAAGIYRLMLEDEKPASVRAAAQLGLGRCLYHSGEYSSAAPILEQSLTGLPERADRDEVLFIAGDARLKTGDNQAAVAHFRELESSYPRSPWAARSSEVTGDLLLEQGRVQEAITSYRRFEESSADTDRGRARLKLATALAEAGAWLETAELTQLAATDSLLDNPSRLRALMLQAAAARATDAIDQVLSAYRTIWATAPDSPEAFEIAPAYGELLSARGETGAAEEVWSSIAANASSDSLRIRAEVELVCLAYEGNRIDIAHERQNTFEQTYRRQREVLEQYRPLFWAVEGQVWLQWEEWSRAEDVFREVMDEAPDSRYVSIALYGLGEVAARREEMEAARGYFEELISRFPDDPHVDRARYRLAGIAYTEADYETAMVHYRMVTASEDPVLAEVAQHDLVQTLERMRMYGSAQQEALTYLERFPDSETAFDMKMRLGQLYSDGGQLGRAAQWYRSMRAPDSEGEARLRYWLAETLFKMGEYQEAVLEYMKIAYLNEDQFLFAVTARLRAADSYAYLGEREQAIDLYRAIIRRYGADSDYGRVARAKLNNVEAGRLPDALPPPSPW